jgi:hypothetical protein
LTIPITVGAPPAVTARGSVIVVPASEVDVIYLVVAKAVAEATPVALIDTRDSGAVPPIKPLVDRTGPEKVVLAMIISPYKVKLVSRVCVCWGSLISWFYPDNLCYTFSCHYTTKKGPKPL